MLRVVSDFMSMLGNGDIFLSSSYSLGLEDWVALLFLALVVDSSFGLLKSPWF